MYTHAGAHLVDKQTASSPSELIRQEGLYVEEELTNRPHQYRVV